VTTESGPVLDQPGGNLALDIFVLDQHIGALLELVFKGTGVSPAQFAVYSQLARGTSTPKALREVLGIRPATLSGYLSAMEDRGDLLRRRDTSDRREHRLALTERGRATRDACRAKFRKAIQALNSELGGAQNVEAVRATLGQVDRAIQRTRQRLDPGP
jgi:DNA-binding MarR family transcriptional regulator